MIGYHYTTCESWKEIQRNGLKLTPLEKHHYKDLTHILDLVKDGCIWLYRKFQTNEQLCGLLIYFAAKHRATRMVCLEIEYSDMDAASYLGVLNEGLGARCNLTHNLDGVGLFDHFNESVELLVNEVSINSIKLVGEWDFLEFAKSGVVEAHVLKRLFRFFPHF